MPAQLRRKLPCDCHQARRGGLQGLCGLGVFQFSGLVEGGADRAHGDDIGEDHDLEVVQQVVEFFEAAQSAQRAGGGGHDGRDLAFEGLQRRVVFLVLAREPVDRVLEHAAIAAVVIGRGDQESVVLREQFLQLLRVVGNALRRLEVAVVQRQGIIGEVNHRHLGPRAMGGLGRLFQQLLVPRPMRCPAFPAPTPSTSCISTMPLPSACAM